MDQRGASVSAVARRGSLAAREPFLSSQRMGLLPELGSLLSGRAECSRHPSARNLRSTRHVRRAPAASSGYRAAYGRPGLLRGLRPSSAFGRKGPNPLREGAERTALFFQDANRRVASALQVRPPSSQKRPHLVQRRVDPTQQVSHLHLLARQDPGQILCADSEGRLRLAGDLLPSATGSGPAPDALSGPMLRGFATAAQSLSAPGPAVRGWRRRSRHSCRPVASGRPAFARPLPGR